MASLVNIFGPRLKPRHVFLRKAAALVVQSNLTAEHLPPVVTQRLGKGIAQDGTRYALSVCLFRFSLFPKNVSFPGPAHGLSAAHKIDTRPGVFVLE